MMLRTIMKARNGEASFDEMLALLEGIGMSVQVTEITAREEMAPINEAASAEGAKLFRMTAKMAGGQPLVALLVLPPG